jgi:hypothetical protein
VAVGAVFVMGDVCRLSEFWHMGFELNQDC